MTVKSPHWGGIYGWGAVEEVRSNGAEGVRDFGLRFVFLRLRG